MHRQIDRGYRRASNQADDGGDGSGKLELRRRLLYSASPENIRFGPMAPQMMEVAWKVLAPAHVNWVDALSLADVGKRN